MTFVPRPAHRLLRRSILAATTCLLASPALAGEDCNGNGIPDAKDLASGFSEDCQGDLVPDECQITEADLLYLYDDDIYEGAVGTDFVASLCWMTRFTVQPGAEIINGVEVAYGVAPVDFPVHIGVWSDPDGDGDPTDAVLLASLDTVVESPWVPVTIVPLAFPETFLGEAGDSFFIGVWGDSFPPAPNCFPAPYDAQSTVNESWWIEKVGPLDPEDPTAGAALSGPISELIPGLVGDWLVRGTYCETGHCDESRDIDGNGVPDECDPDCNGNGIPDGIDIANGAPDCNANAIIDTCEIGDDCDGNGVPDDCQRDAQALLGEYYPNVELAGEPISRLDAGIFFDFGPAESRPEGIPGNDFSVRWTGALRTTVAGEYELGLRHDDGVRLYIDGTPVIDRWGPSGGDLDTVIIEFGADEQHHVRLDYYQGAAGALLEFTWREPGGSELVPIPASAFTPSIDSDGDGVNDVCGVSDCNRNLVPDALEIANGGDCDADGVLDACQSDDCNANGIVDSCEGVASEGLFGEYFASDGDPGRFSRRVATRFDPVVDFDWGAGSPFNLPVDSFTVSWSGSVVATEVAGIHEFEIRADDGLRFWVDGELLIDVWEANTATFFVDLDFEAASVHTIRIEMFELGGSASCSLKWRPPGGASGIIPAANLRPFPDVDGNGLDDRCELDCDGDGISDASAILAGTPDCNGNGVPDDCDLAMNGAAPSLAWWRFEGSGATAVDSGPDGLDADLVNVTRLGDVPVDAIPLTGDADTGSLGFQSGSRMTVDDPGDLLAGGGSAFTIEAWVRLDTLGDTSGNGQRQWLACRKPVGGDQRIDWGVLVQAGNYASSCREVYGGPAVASGRELVATGGFGSGDSTSKWAAVSNLRIDDLDWHHVAVTIDELQRLVRFSLDGEVEIVPLGARYFATREGPLQIGCHVNSSGQFNQTLRGAVDELRITAGIVSAPQLLDFPFTPVSGDTDADGVPDECVATCLGDLDGDGEVGGSDLGLMLVEWALTGSGLTADLNDDGVVGGADLGLLLVGWGDC